MRLTVLVGLCALASCSTYEQRIAGHCARLGATMDSPYYWSCIDRTEQLDQRNREMWSGAAIAGAGMLAPAPQFYVLPTRY